MQYPHLNWQWQEELDAVLAELPLSSPYGCQAFKIKFYSQGQEEALNLELAETNVFFEFFRRDQALRKELPQFLANLPNISLEIDLLRKDYSLTHEGCLKIKRFLLALDKNRLPVLEILPFISETPKNLCFIQEGLKILDPSGLKLPTFYLDRNFSTQLVFIRQEKTELQKQIRAHPYEEAYKEEFQKKVEAEKEEEDAVLNRLSLKLQKMAYELEQICSYLGRVDFLAAKSEMARSKNMTMPGLSYQDRIVARGLRHPIAEAALKKKNLLYQPLDLDLPLGTAALTGANMSGKSMALKSLVLNQYLFQIGFFVFAQEFKAPLFHNLTMIDEVKQSLERGLSSFAAEIDTLQNFLRENSHKKSLLVLDEFARSTNPQEGSALLASVLEKRESQPGLTLAATHYDEVACFAQKHYQVVGLHDLSVEQIKEELTLGQDPFNLLREKMNYAWRPEDQGGRVPKEARLVAELLGLDKEILANLENKITKRKE